MENFDFHIHSTCSDGEKDVSEIIEYAKKHNFRAISIADHDNIDSLDKIAKCDLSELKCIPGVEISTKYLDYDMHILCYGFRRTDSLKKIIEYQKQMRINKFDELLKQLNEKYGISFDKKELENLHTKNSLGKNDIAYLLQKNNYVRERKEAFDKYICNLSSRSIKKVEFGEIVKAMKADDGITIMAHPYEVKNEYNLSQEELYNLIDSVIEAGCNGIEAFHSVYDYQECNKLKEYAQKVNCIISAGSDFHRDESKNNDGIGFLYLCENDLYKNLDEKDISILTIIEEEGRWIQGML